MRKHYIVKDKYFEKAKKEGFRARSVYKLEGIQERYKILKSGNIVLDLGAAPGSFLQFISKTVGKKGLAVGVDLLPIKRFKLNNIVTIQADIFEEEMKKALKAKGFSEFNVITSDLAPKTTGIKSVDAGRSFELSNQVLNIVEQYLKKGGHVVLKLLPGVDQSELLKRIKGLFLHAKVFKPQAVRKTSREVYFIGLRKKRSINSTFAELNARLEEEASA